MYNIIYYIKKPVCPFSFSVSLLSAHQIEIHNSAIGKKIWRHTKHNRHNIYLYLKCVSKVCKYVYRKVTGRQASRFNMYISICICIYLHIYIILHTESGEEQLLVSHERLIVLSISVDHRSSLSIIHGCSDHENLFSI